MISDIESTWLRNEKCFMIYGKSFDFFRKWEGDPIDAKILVNGIDDEENTRALFDGNSSSFIETQGEKKDTYEIFFNESVMINAITIGTVIDVRKYSNICFEIIDSTSVEDASETNDDTKQETKPNYSICTKNQPEFEFITLMIPEQMVTSVRFFFKDKYHYKISSLAIYHRGKTERLATRVSDTFPKRIANMIEPQLHIYCILRPKNKTLVLR